MWIFLNDAFLSIVQDHNQSDKLLVRGRVAGDIERVFATAEVIKDAGTDYPYRAWVEREAVANALYWQAQSIGYGNFKSSVQEDDRHDAYMSVWGVMQRFQHQRAGKARQPAMPLFYDDEDDQPTVTRQAKTPARNIKRKPPTRRAVA